MNGNQLGHHFTAYPSLQLVPAGRKHPVIRSIGHKEERAVLSRLQQIVSAALDQLLSNEQQLLREFLKLSSLQLPVPICKQQTLCPYLMKPELFLWKTHSPNRGLPIEETYFYKTQYHTLSTRQLTAHIHHVVRDYVFCARLQQLDRNMWLERINKAYTEHPFILLSRSKQTIVNAVESMNRSSLLSVLNYPEDIAYWRHRVEIVLRPYRSIPPAWQDEICVHAKNISLQPSSESILVTCPECSFSITYWPITDQLKLPFEVKIKQAVKRIATIERQFNQIALQSSKIVASLNQLRRLKSKFTPYYSLGEELIQLSERLGEETEPHSALDCFSTLKEISLPDKEITPDLISLAKVNIPDIAVLRSVEKWQSIDFHSLKDDFNRLYQELLVKEALRQPKPEDILFQVKNLSLTRAQLEKIKTFIEETELTLSLHLLVQTVKGEATNKIRRLGLHDTEIFGMMQQWPEKHITQAMKKHVK
ncbi:RQC-minor-2 family DNA-binding protein [Jeotgalibacillus campisalis]|uniref:RQC domain-containing protein n=1 Tax=Jeotgalibacillus campisalis TaxID=220754 RepID=A0A0C2SGM8_9BACL|nr:RQC-minor-2 family DNA-binding protein [Jeotgalibacillus campisalis]KIL53079.1 hypothetical protein KR50_04080 [Jeotgalibacillus campisalis]